MTQIMQQYARWDIEMMIMMITMTMIYHEMVILESMGFDSSSQIHIDYECFEQEIIGQVCSEAVLVRVEGAEYADCDGWHS